MEELIKLLNEVISSCEPIKYDEWNKTWKFKEGTDLDKYDVIVNRNNEVSTISLIATITEKLYGEPLTFILEDGLIVGVGKYTGEQETYYKHKI